MGETGNDDEVGVRRRCNCFGTRTTVYLPWSARERLTAYRHELLDSLEGFQEEGSLNDGEAHSVVGLHDAVA